MNRMAGAESIQAERFARERNGLNALLPASMSAGLTEVAFIRASGSWQGSAPLVDGV